MRNLLTVIGIGNRAVSRPDAVDEPLGVKGRDIRTSAGADDQS